MAQAAVRSLVFATMLISIMPLEATASGICYGANSHATSYAVSAVSSYTATQYYTTSCGWWGWGRCGRYRTVTYYTTTYHVQYTTMPAIYTTTQFCCPGYVGSPPSCSDINECSTNNGGCGGTCVNTAGSYHCTCPSGCTLDSNGHACNDIDECSTSVCSHNCHNNGNCGGFYCTCNAGYTLDSDGHSCLDVNECSTSNGGCTETCTNTAGSYYCTCPSGYSLASNAHGCNDINECNSNNGGCSQVCTNTIGSFECSCNTGYELDSDESTCVDINECSTNNGGCGGTCVNTAGSYYCTCPSGCTLDSNGHACNDINECSAGTDNCAQNCHNIGNCGGFSCSCNTGYTLDSNGHSCSDINECSTNDGGCSGTCVNTAGSYYCTCPSGYSLGSNSHSCIDINECSTNKGGCSHTCTNTIGSFICTCDAGYEVDALDCVDTNECGNSNGGCAQTCVNTVGSYYCTCPSGCTLNSNGHACNDINECSAGTENCAQNCHNNGNCGGFSCSCNTGYTLDSNGHSCSDINECSTNNGGCGGTCVNTAGSYYCTCPSGCTLDSNGHACNDINECSSGTDNCVQNCHNNANCGGFDCSCNTGYTLDSDDYSCPDINECSTSNGGCAQTCHNTVGSYYCTCGSGYSLASNNHGCVDINECNTSMGGCNQVCTNTIGSFVCSCNTGYELDSDQRTCVDTNECGSSNGGCVQNCHNSIGSYTCTCNSSYTLNSNGHSCDDINECTLMTDLCHHECINTIGSYICDCNVGYMLNSNGLSCTDIDECGTNNGECDQNCHNTVGSYYCTCNTGYLLDEDNHGCSDHHECNTNSDNCDQHCHNTHGSFYCSCDAGWRLDPNGYTCNDTNECKEHSSGCTQICNNTPGSYFCTCHAGYILDSNNHTCNDVNECATGNGGCEQNCNNTVGSYDCSCNVGFQLGNDYHTCPDVVECDTDNGNCDQDCHNTVGSYYCTCGSGWRLDPDGHSCNDTNECLEETSGCTQICNNTLGSYFCTCKIGYSLHSDNHTCVDIDECGTNNGGCDQNCHNTNGSYYCTCNTGYLLDEDNHGCLDIDECANSNGNCDQDCHNTNGSYYCTCGSGWRLDPDGHTCNDTNECKEHSSGCSQICNNTPGSYFCTCFTGFNLDPDNHTCNDINECATGNGGCEQNCNNTVGSYDCSCNVGFQLGNDYHACPDVDECTVNNGNCDQDCHNTYGSYYCTCGSGWRLDPDGHTCNDTDECEENSSGCIQICNNTPGSYFCTCNIGYSLDADNHTCNDVNECNTTNGGCIHICTNEVGSYQCSCRAGYDLSADNHGCDAQPCDRQLVAPQNGSIWCSGDQVTDQNCSFACDAGFTFTGSELRKCLSNNSWTGVDVVCIPKHCHPLTNPPNGYVDIVNDCETVLTTMCEIKCVEGYYINNTTPFYQTCVANKTSGNVYWTTAPDCELIPPCHPNPCKHSGVCTEVDTMNYSCACYGTHYKGENCEIGIVDFPRIPILTVNTSVTLKIVAFPDNFINITFIGASTLEIYPSSVTVTNELTEVAFVISTRVSGKFILTYTITGSSAANFEDPLVYHVLSIESSYTQPPNRYFTELGTDVGLLIPGCCNPGGVSYQCPVITTNVSFSSTCSWMLDDNDLHVTDGVVFASGPSLDLPISISGIKLSPGLTENVLPSEQLTCIDCGGTEPHCYHYDFSVSDIADLLRSSALGKTYLHNIRNLIPSWISFRLSNSTLPLQTSFSLSDYYTTLASTEQVNLVHGCEGLRVDQNGLFSILSLDSNITIVSSNFIEREYVPTAADPPTCFAVDLCRGSSSPVHITIPAGSQDMLTSFNQLKMYTDKGWDFTFTDATLSHLNVLSPFSITSTYWNGLTYFEPNIPTFDLRLAMSMKNRLTSNNLWIDFDFNGDLFHQANSVGTQVEGILTGDITLSANMTLNGEPAHIIMLSYNKPAIFSMPGYPTSNHLGSASFKLHYTSESSFGVLPLPENEHGCPSDVYIEFKNNTGDLGWMSFTIQCSALSISGFSFPAGSVINYVYFVGFLNPPTSDSNLAGATAKVQTHLVSSPLQLNHYFSILQPYSGPAISTGYWRNEKQEGMIYKAAFALLGTYFTAPVEISNAFLKFTANVELFGKYRSLISGNIAGGHAWTNAPVSISGKFDMDVLKSLQNYTYNQVMSKIALAEERIQNADVARSNTHQQLEELQASYIEHLAAKQAAESDYQHALQEEAIAASAVAAAQANVDAASMNVLKAQSRVTAVCGLEECDTECVPGVACQSCENHVSINNWVHCKQITSDNMITYRMTSKTEQTCVYERQCRIITKVKGWATTIFGQTCSYVCHPNIATEEVEEAYYTVVNVSHTSSCSTTSTALSINQICCTEEPCSQSIQNMGCLYRNTFCEFAQKPAYAALNNTQKQLVAPLLELSEASTNHSIAIALLAAAEAHKNVTEQQFLLILPTYFSLTQAAQISELNYQSVLEEEQPTLDLKNYLFNNSIESLVRIVQINFSVTLQQDVDFSTFPLSITVLLPSLNQTFVTLATSLDLSSPDEIVKREIFDEIISTVHSELSEQSSRRRRSYLETSSNIRHFETNCATISNLKNYLNEINQTLDKVSSHFESSNHNVTDTVNKIIGLLNIASSLNGTISIGVNYTFLLEEFGSNVTESDLIEQTLNSSALSQVIEIVKSIATASESVLEASDTNMFIQWQISMGTIHSVSGMTCFGFPDCLIIISSMTQQLLVDMPEDMSNNLLTFLPPAQLSLTELGLATNLSFAEAKAKTNPMFVLLTNIQTLGYWCSTPPVITEQPESEVNIDLDDQLSISCQANSSISISYGWKKDKFSSPNYTTNMLTKPTVEVADSGVYQCLANNPVDTTSSLYSTVTVFEPPVITLAPSDFTTFEGDDNGAVFVCNATAKPSPNYQWYWSPDGGTSWTTVVNGTSNELFLPKPKVDDEGLYRCQAYTVNEGVQSSPAQLTILPVLISKLVYQISFKLYLLETLEIAGSGSGSASDNPEISELIKQAVLYTLTEKLRSKTTEIGDDIIILMNKSTNFVQINTNLSTHHNLPLNETLADIALLAQIHYENIIQETKNLKLMLQNMSLILTAGPYKFSVGNETVIIGALEYSCPSGYVLKYSDFLCIGCPPGQYHTAVNDMWVCSECDIGYYQAKAGSTSCVQCPNRYTTVSHGSRLLDQCLALCHPGHYNSSNGVEPCQPCPDQTYQLNWGAKSCFPCEKGFTFSACLQYPVTSTIQQEPSNLATPGLDSSVPTPSLRVEGPQIIIIGSAAAAGIACGVILVILIMMIVVLTYRKIKRKQPISSSENYSSRSSQSLTTAEFKVPNVNFIKLYNVSSSATINTPASSGDIWKANPLYMASDEIAEENDSCVDQISYDQKSVHHEDDQEEFLDEPVSLGDYDRLSEYEYDDQRRLIQ